MVLGVHDKTVAAASGAALLARIFRAELEDPSEAPLDSHEDAARPFEEQCVKVSCATCEKIKLREHLAFDGSLL